MKFNLHEFCTDLIAGSSTVLNSKYQGRIPPNLTKAMICEHMIDSGLARQVIRSWHADEINIDGLYLIQANEKYEVFIGERNGKHWLNTFDKFEDAVLKWIGFALFDVPLHQNSCSKKS